MNPTRILLALFVITHSALFAAVTPAPLFKDNAVLQRDKPVPVWGVASAGEKVSVSFADQTKVATADADGRWSVTLDPLPANAEPAAMTITGENTITLSNILVGEVWIASGQSNMGWPVRLTYDAAIDIAGSTNPLIREIKLDQNVADSPTTEASGVWRSAADDPRITGSFSAVAYYFARDIHALVGVPVGIINSSWGGTRAEAWTDPDTLAGKKFGYIDADWKKALAEYPEKKAKHEADLTAWKQERNAAHDAGRSFSKREPYAPWGPGHQATPSGLYNGMVHPLVPYAIRGVIWYQGEANAGRPFEYADLFPAMITGWRAKFNQGDFPFYWVQLANYQSPTATNWAFLRESQTKTLALPATGQAVTIDIGDVGEIHPRNKKDVGRRLARLALARDYGFKIIDSGPVFEKAEREGAGFRITFKTEGNLRAPLNELGGFELAGEDKVFKPAQAKIDGTTVIVTNTEVTEPIAVRYAWRDAPLAGLFNDEGLPAVPFRTDDWR